MKKLGMAVVGISLVVNFVLAADLTKIDFQWNYKQRAAQTLFEKKDYAGAQKAADDLVATAPDEQAKVKCISLSAVAMAHQDQYDQAIKKAQDIADKPLADLTRMEIMTVGKKQADLIAAFKDADLAAWPTNIAYKGFLQRGEAYRSVADDKAALADLEQAAGRAGTKETELQMETLNKIGALYEKLQDPARALEAYRKILTIGENPKVKGGARQYPPALMAAVRILKDQKQYEEALALLSKYDPSRSNSWGPRVLETSGDIYVAMGKKDEALAKYQEAGKLAGDNKRFVENINKKIEGLK
jgi:tetratricopeptide (TPR) repeat protein